MLRRAKKIEVQLPKTSVPYVVKGGGFEVEFTGGMVVVRSGEVELGAQARLATTASPAALKVGDVVQEGPDKGWVYCETAKGDAFLVAPKDSGVMKWREAMDYAAREKSELPSREELKAMYEARDSGALKGTFNITGSFPAGWYWSAAQYGNGLAWCQRFSDGNQAIDIKGNQSSVRCVRRYSII